MTYYVVLIERESYMYGVKKVWKLQQKVYIQNENITMSIREASILYNVPFETLRRCVNSSVIPGYKSGPATVLTEEEEEHLESYLIQMVHQKVYKHKKKSAKGVLL